jgi:hypothetical protein
MLLFGVGRIDPCKRFEWIIETLARVRSRLPEVRLHIVNPAEILPGTKEYRKSLCSLIRANAEWVDWHEDLSREELIALLSHTRYGIHAHTHAHDPVACRPRVGSSHGCRLNAPPVQVSSAQLLTRPEWDVAPAPIGAVLSSVRPAPGFGA